MQNKSIAIVWVTLTAAVLAGCTPSELKAPCGNYGAFCHKVPINSWNYNDL